MAILFWFYKDPRVSEARLRCIKRLNPEEPIFGLFGGPRSSLPDFTRATKVLDDCWIHEEVPSEWAWFNGDLMLANWFRMRGYRLDWKSVFVHQWDLLMGCPIDRFCVGDREVLLPGVRPLAELARDWVWIQPWSRHRGAFEAFCRHPTVRGQALFGCIFALATFPRNFLADYAGAASGIPGFAEYRLPTLASIMGYGHAECSLRPDWGDRGDPLFNGGQSAVTLGQATRCQRLEPRLVWHPVYEVVEPDELESLIAAGNDCLRSGGEAPDPRDRTVAIIQVPPARPGRAAGGAQVVARELCRGMLRAGIRPIVFAGTADGAPCRWSEDGIDHRAAFSLDDSILSRGNPTVRYFPGELDVMGRCEAVVMFDRAFPVPAGRQALLMLGAADYPFAEEATLADGWNEMLVPSEYVANRARSWLIRHGRTERCTHVHVVGNPVAAFPLGLHENDCAIDKITGPPYRLLFAHRADRGKGFEASVRLLAGLGGRRARLHVTVDTSPTADPSFYGDLMMLADGLGVTDSVALEPWRPRHLMAGLYRLADLTVCLGDVPEGFGLTCVESVLCGTPVLARDVGAQLHTLPPEHGCFPAPARPDELVDAARRVLESPVAAAQTRCGAAYIRERYCPDAFVRRVLALAGI